MMSHTLGSLYLVATPRPHMPESEFLARIRAALDGGVGVLQLRCKETDALAYLKLADKVGPLARSAGVPFIINDRADVALATGADGVHLGQDDLPVEHARRVLRANAVIGRSSHEAAHASRAIAECASYFAVGPVWETPTKPGRSAAGLSYVREVSRLGPAIPWYAIGGINLQNVNEVIADGASRIALVRAVLDAADPAVAANAFATKLAAAAQARAAAQEAVCT
jgi:thiamine-phosphate pyrophosphorylase